MNVDIEAIYQKAISTTVGCLRYTDTKGESIVLGTVDRDLYSIVIERDVAMALVEEVRLARAVPKRYFRADLNGCKYTCVASSRAHAWAMLKAGHVDLSESHEDDDSNYGDRPSTVWRELTWQEIRDCHPLDGDHVRNPLTTYPLGMWFSSEF